MGVVNYLTKRQNQHYLAECRQGVLLQINFYLAGSNGLLDGKMTSIIGPYYMDMWGFESFSTLQKKTFPKYPPTLGSGSIYSDRLGF